jgi:hypothetical protein
MSRLLVVLAVLVVLALLVLGIRLIDSRAADGRRALRELRGANALIDRVQALAVEGERLGDTSAALIAGAIQAYRTPSTRKELL